ncbi:MAG: hypothetical protein ABSA74_00495 [Candidatus Staskawiczbacteria bacterium]|jgi:hypothetical protein
MKEGETKNIEDGPSFLESYRVPEKEEAKRAAKKKELRTGEKGIFADKTKRVQAYLERLENVFLNENEDTRERNINLLKPAIYKNTIIKEENFPESYFEFKKQQAHERGRGEISFDEEEKQKEIEKVKDAQEKSLDSWIDYLTGNDCKYPTDVKFFAMQGVLKLGKFDTEKYSFAKRGKETTAPFAEVDREALSIVLGALDAKHHGKDFSGYSSHLLEIIDKKGSFGDMYAETMRDLDSKADKESLLPITDGEWRVFEKGSDPKILSAALAGKRSNLCIADIGSASQYLAASSVEIFFSYNHAKQPTVPRIAIAFGEDDVEEVRGTFNKSEDMDPFISATNTLADRLQNLPNGESFLKKNDNMRRLTAIEKKFIGTKDLEKELEKIRQTVEYYEDGRMNETDGEKCRELRARIEEIQAENKKVELSKEEIKFLYEVDAPLDGFGYQKDPRIERIVSSRDKRADLAFALDVPPERISFQGDDLRRDDIFFHYGDISLHFVGKNLSEHGVQIGANFPRYMSGDFRGSGVPSEFLNGRKLPEHVSGVFSFDFEAGEAKLLDPIKLPKYVGGFFAFQDHDYSINPANVKFPEYVGGEFLCQSFETPEGFVPPKYVGGKFNLGVKSAEGLKLPEHVGEGIEFSFLKTARGLVLPEKQNGHLIFRTLNSIEGLVLPNWVGGDLRFDGLESADGLKFPEHVGGCLVINMLKSADGVELPKFVGNTVYINENLKSLVKKYPNLKFKGQ